MEDYGKNYSQKIKDTVRNFKADKREKIAQQVRLKYLDRWKERTEEITGEACDYDGIDYGD